MTTSNRKKPHSPGLVGRTSTAEFDRELVVDSFAPLDVEAAARWSRVKRKRGRPRVGSGAAVISVSVEKGLLERTDFLANQLGITRASLIARGLRAVLAAQGEGSERRRIA